MISLRRSGKVYLTEVIPINSAGNVFSIVSSAGDNRCPDAVSKRTFQTFS
jgi:hypothetical protein